MRTEKQAEHVILAGADFIAICCCTCTANADDARIARDSFPFPSEFFRVPQDVVTQERHRQYLLAVAEAAVKYLKEHQP